MADFEGFTAEVKLMIMEQAEGYGDLVNLVNTSSDLRALFHTYHKQILAAVGRNYEETSTGSLVNVFHAVTGADAVYNYPIEQDSGPENGYWIDRDEDFTFNPMERLHMYHRLTSEISALADCIRKAYESACVLLVRQAQGMDRFTETLPSTEFVEDDVFFNNARPVEGAAEPQDLEGCKVLLEEAKINFALQALTQCSFEELVAVGDILNFLWYWESAKCAYWQRDRKVNPKEDGKDTAFSAEKKPGFTKNETHELLRNLLASHEPWESNLLGYIWVLIRKHENRDNSIATRYRITYRMAQKEIFELMAREVYLRRELGSRQQASEITAMDTSTDAHEADSDQKIPAPAFARPNMLTDMIRRKAIKLRRRAEHTIHEALGI